METTEAQKPMPEKLELGELGKALTIFQSSCPTIPKTQQGYGYKYADISDIVETIKPHLKTSGLAVSQLVFNKGGDVGVKTILIHGDSGQYLSSTISADMVSNKAKQMTNVQGMGSIVTYLRRYSMSAILGIVTDEDTDGAVPQSNSSSQNNGGAKKTTAPAQKKDSDNTKPVFLTEEQFKKAMEADLKGVTATLKSFSTKDKKMKADYKKQLEARKKELETAEKKTDGEAK